MHGVLTGNLEYLTTWKTLVPQVNKRLA